MFLKVKFLSFGLFSNKYKPESQNKSDLMNIAGVYIIRVLNSNDYYIGSASNLFIRLLQQPSPLRASFGAVVRSARARKGGWGPQGREIKVE